MRTCCEPPETCNMPVEFAGTVVCAPLPTIVTFRGVSVAVTLTFPKPAASNLKKSTSLDEQSRPLRVTPLASGVAVAAVSFGSFASVQTGAEPSGAFATRT